MEAIDKMFLFSGNHGRKLDALVSEYLLMKSDPTQRSKTAEVKRVLKENHDMLEWTNIRLAKYFFCSDKLIRNVKRIIAAESVQYLPN